MNKARLAHARSFGCETVDLTLDATLAEQITQILGVPEIDCAVDCVGFEASSHGTDSKKEVPAAVLNSLMEITGAGGSISIPGLYVTEDPGAEDKAAQKGSLSLRFRLGQKPLFPYWPNACDELQPPAYAGYLVR